MPLLLDLFLSVKSRAERVPGAFRVYKLVTSRTGEGRVYTIRNGPLAGARWKRYNSLPFWYHRGVYEPPLSEFIARHLQPGDVFWDLGAHAGYHALVAARRVGPRGRVIAVEPEPGHCRILREQMALNGIDHCEVVEAAVADREGVLTLLRQAADSRTSALAGIARAGEPISVRGLTLDHLAEAYPAPALVKIDIEGAETVALPASRLFLSERCRPRHVVIATHGEEAMRVSRRFLEQHGYRVEPDRADPRTLVAEDVPAAVA